MNILLAFDGSEAALHACRLVAAFANAQGASQVTLLNVQRPPLLLSPQGGVSYTVLEDALREEGGRLLQQAMDVLAAGGCTAQAISRVGPPAAIILEAARERGADVLVLGNGRTGILGGYALGSVALRVAPAAHCPTVLVGARVRLPGAPGRALRVAVPVDGSVESLQAVQRLVRCAGLLGRLQVDLLHFQPGITLAASILPPHDDVLREWSGRESDAALTQAMQLLGDAGIAHEVHRLTGDPASGIAAFSRTRGCELIAMGTRGLGAMHHLLMGSVALQTVRASDVPVALLR